MIFNDKQEVDFQNWEWRYLRVFGNHPYYSTRKFIDGEIQRARCEGADALIFALRREQRRKGSVTFSRIGFFGMAAGFWVIGHIANAWWPIVGLAIGCGITWVIDKYFRKIL